MLAASLLEALRAQPLALRYHWFLQPIHLLLLLLLVVVRLGPWQLRLVQQACQTAHFHPGLQAWQTAHQLVPERQGPLLLLLLL
jgi:hypothetical protein